MVNGAELGDPCPGVGTADAGTVGRRGRIIRTAYRLAWLPFIMLGALGELEHIWKVSDTMNGLMAIPNLIAILALGGIVVKLTKGFLAGEPYRPPADQGV